jgi:hypothetical protein
MSRWLRSLLTALGVAIAGAALADPVRLIFVGDIMLDDGPGRLISRGGDPLAFPLRRC